MIRNDCFWDSLRPPSLWLIGLNGAHSLAYIYTFTLYLRRLIWKGPDIMGVTLKLLNPCYRGFKGEWGVEGGSGERVSAAAPAFRETVKQNDSGGLLFERLPACQFRCNVFIDSLLSATWQPSRGSTFPVPRQKLRVCETGSLGKLGEKVSLLLPSPLPQCSAA